MRFGIFHRRLYICSSGPKLKEVEDLKPGDEYQGQALKASGKERKRFFDVKEEFLLKIKECLTARFIDSDEAVIKASGIIHLNSWPRDDNLKGMILKCVF